MKSALIFTAFVCGLCWGQTANDCKPSSLNIPGAPYPCIYPDHRVAFRVAAPDAVKVQVRLGGVHDMTGEAFSQMMLTDLIPMIERMYRVLPGRENRAMAGLSMGGAQTFKTALNNLDRFAYLGGFSGSCAGRDTTFDPKTSCGGAFADPAAFNKKVKVLFLGIGSAEGPGTKNFSDALTNAGIHNVYFESPGTAHEWLTWRRCLNDFAPRLFR